MLQLKQRELWEDLPLLCFLLVRLISLGQHTANLYCQSACSRYSCVVSWLVMSPSHPPLSNFSLQLFQWKQLENLYFREKKFAVEVNDPHRSEKEKHFIYLNRS